MAAQVVLQVVDKQSSQCVPPIAELGRWVNLAMEAVLGVESTDWEVVVRVVDTNEIKRLNREFRGKDCATNILSFPVDEDYWEPDSEIRELGDLVVCAQVVWEEARQMGLLPEDHWAHMIIHGSLHLLGYDHESSDETRIMEQLEVRLLAKLGIADPYVDGD